MFKRSFIILIIASALLWIAYVGFTLASGSSNAPRPENVFSQQDDTVLVVHNTLEVNYDLPLFVKLQKKIFFIQLLNNQERIQHYFFSINRELVVLERSKPWTRDKVKAYFEKLLLSSSINPSKSFSISNGWKGSFHGKYLLIYKGEWQAQSRSIIDWKYIDRKSSFSTICKDQNKNYKIENCYYLNNITSRYTAQKNNTELPLVNDQEVFQEYIPANFDSYTFYETNYLNSLYPEKSILSKWINFGCVLVTKGKDSCLLTDFKLGSNPIEELNDLNNSDLNIKSRQALLRNQSFQILTKKKDYYLEVFNNMVYVSSSKNFINQLIGDYETGNTLAQSISLKDKLSSNSTQSVSYRFIDKTKQITLSKLPEIDYETISIYSEQEENSVEKEENNQLTPIRLDDDLVELNTVPNSNNIIAITRSNTVYSIGTKKVNWSKQLNSEALGEPVFIGDGIFIPTKSSIYAFDQTGNNIPGFPIVREHITSCIYPFYWSGKDYISFTTDKEVVAYTTAGKQIYRANLSKISSFPSNLVVQGKKGDLIAHICSNNIWQSISLKRNKTIATKTLANGEWKIIKVDGSISVLGISNKRFGRIAENGNQSILINQSSTKFFTQTLGSETYFYIPQGNSVFVISDRGVVLGQISTKVTDFADIKFNKEKKIISLIDAISNNCYIYNIKGHKIGDESYEGANKVCLQKLDDGTFLLNSQSNGYLVRYKIK